jgi:probable HAF family extracellular repeat protein
MKRIAWLMLALAGVAVFGLAGTAGATLFHFQDLTSSLGAGSHPELMNDAGQIAGRKSDYSSAFLWTPGAGMQYFGDSHTYLAAMNNSGQVVGTFAPFHSHAYLWTPGQGVQDLGTLGGDQSSAYGINDAGQVVGVAQVSVDIGYHAFLWTSGGGMQDLTPSGVSYSAGYAINKSGQIAGTDGSYLCLLFLGNPPQDLYTAGWGTPRAMNMQGNIVGVADLDHLGGLGQAFFYNLQAGIMTNLTPGDYGAAASGINDANQVVGSTGMNLNFGPFFWSPSSGLKHLNQLVVDLPSGVTVESALSINNKGEILGIANNGNPCLLTPIAGSSGSTLLLLLQ